MNMNANDTTYAARKMEQFVSISEMKQGMAVSARLLVSQKELNPRKNPPNSHFLVLSFMDKTGTIIGKVWERAEEWYTKIDPGDVLEVQAHVKSFNNNLELSIVSMRKVTLFDPAEFLPTTKEDRGEMYTQILEWISEIEHPGLRRLLQFVFEEDEKLSQAFTEAIGATRNHHAYIGGLLEHTYYVTRIGRFMADVYPNVNLDLLTAGCLLHDIGKIKTYEWKSSFDRSLEGRMLEHIHLGMDMISTILREQGITLDQTTHMKLLNMIASHHGRPEFGSSQPILTVEAFILHMADMIDSTMNRIEAALDDVVDGWTTQKVQVVDRSVNLFVG